MTMTNTKPNEGQTPSRKTIKPNDDQDQRATKGDGSKDNAK